jgi:hypothetical protein
MPFATEAPAGNQSSKENTGWECVDRMYVAVINKELDTAAITAAL